MRILVSALTVISLRQKWNHDLFDSFKISLSTNNVCLGKLNPCVIPSISTLVFKLAVVNIDLVQIFVVMDKAVPYLVSGRMQRRDKAGEIGFHIMQRGVKDTTYRPIPEWIGESFNEKLIVFSFGSMLCDRWQGKLP